MKRIPFYFTSTHKHDNQHKNQLGGFIGGHHFVPIASLRLKLSRDGLEDLEYMYLLEDLTGSREAVEAIVSRVVQTTYDFNHDGAVMAAARLALAEAIEKAQRGH